MRGAVLILFPGAEEGSNPIEFFKHALFAIVLPIVGSCIPGLEALAHGFQQVQLFFDDGVVQINLALSVKGATATALSALSFITRVSRRKPPQVFLASKWAGGYCRQRPSCHSRYCAGL